VCAVICFGLAPSLPEILLLAMFVRRSIVVTVSNFTHPVIVDRAAIRTATAGAGWIYVNEGGAVGGTFGALDRSAFALARIFGLGHNASRWRTLRHRSRQFRRRSEFDREALEAPEQLRKNSFFVLLSCLTSNVLLM
jgi:hypothetical protein